MKNKELKKEFNLMWFGDSKKGKTGILATVLTCDNDGGSARIIMNFIEEQLKAKEKEVLERLIESDWDKPEIKEPLDWLKRNEVLDEAIATFKEYRNEPMTGNVVILELKALKHGK